MLSISEKQNILNVLDSGLKADKNEKAGSKSGKLAGVSDSFLSKADSIEISDTAKAFKRVNDFLDLGKPDRLNTDDMSPGEEEEFLKMLSMLLKRGVVGYETLEVDGKPEKHFMVTQIGDDRLYGAKLYNEEGTDY